MNLDLLGSLKKLRSAYEERTEVERERNYLLHQALLEVKKARRAHERIGSELSLFNENFQRVSFAASRAADSLYAISIEKTFDSKNRRRPKGE